MNIRVLAVDDTVVFRKIVSEALAAIPGVEVVGTANNGRTAMAKLLALRPDLLTLDLEMPEMSGLEVLDAIREKKLGVGVIVLSSITLKGSEATLRALEKGAFDFVTKPVDGTLDENRERLRQRLDPLIKAFARRHEIKSILKGAAPAAGASPAGPRGAAKPAAPLDDVSRRMKHLANRTKASLLLIGVSTGGPNALAVVLPQLPADLGVPVLIVQHMPPVFTQSLAASLNAKCAIRVKEAQDGELALPNVAYIAPGGKQMKLAGGPNGDKVIRITDDPPENNCRPAVDYLFRSVSLHFPGQAAAVIMTGMGSDGTLGLKLLKRSPCYVIAQDEASCVVFGMPKEAIAAGVVDVVVSVEKIADEIRQATRGPGA